MSSDAITSQSRSAFMEHYTRCRNILNNADIQLTPTLSLELYSALYVLCDFAVYCSSENRNKTISDALLSQIIHNLSGSYPGFTTDAMRERVMFYSMVMGDLELHSHALMGKDTSEAHPVVRCCIAFSDCCLYPPYIDDYNAPQPTLDAVDVFTFSMEIMHPLNEEFASLHKCIRDICSVTPPITVAHSKSEPKKQGGFSLKEKLTSLLGGAGVVLYYLIILTIAIFPFLLIDIAWWIEALLILVYVLFPSSSIIFWIWGLVCAITGPQDAWAIIFYILFAILWLPYFINIIAALLSGKK